MNTELANQQTQRTLQLMAEAENFTSPLLTVFDEAKGNFGIASAVLVLWEGVRLAFTGEHVLRENPKALILDMPAIEHQVLPTKDARTRTRGPADLP